MRNILIIFISMYAVCNSFCQNFDFDYGTSGRRVCLIETEVNLTTPSVTVKLLDNESNTSNNIFIYRRQLGEKNWVQVASNLSPSTQQWTDSDVSTGDVWEYQVRRKNTWSYYGSDYDAIGYTIGSLGADRSDYQGQIILLVASDIVTGLSSKFLRLKKELTAEGWYVNVISVNRANSWDSGNDVTEIRSRIQDLYNNAPSDDKPKILFILGHVPMPRSGSGGYSPDGHYWHQGARGCDAYYADIDGIYTDDDEYNPDGLLNNLQSNFQDDYRWDQDFFPSDIEMAFGRVDFADLTDLYSSEIQLIGNYLDKLSNYRNVISGYDMGDKTAFYLGSYHNSNDGSYRSLPNISKSENVYQNKTGGTHPQWVKNNGPFKVYMQNEYTPEISEWNTYGMDATVYSSDQSSWGFNDLPQEQGYLMSRIRALIGTDSKCLIALWTTSAVNIFHQAGTGLPLGLAMKEIMNHNQTNQLLEKPQQDFDSKEFWNRTLFSFTGDPAIRLYQVSPPVNPSISVIGAETVLEWESSADEEILGYNIYESDSEFGKYSKINNSIITETSYTVSNYNSSNWYMIRAVKMQETGCGKFINPSIGVFVSKQVSTSGSLRYDENKRYIGNVYPNPANEKIIVYTETESDIKIIDLSGKVIFEKYNVSGETELNKILENGVYFIIVINSFASFTHKIIVK